LNEKQRAYWNEVAGPRWAAADEAMETIEAPLLDRLMQGAAPAAGEAILDVGCGSGRSTVLLARAAAPNGRVLGVDLSRPLLELARARLERAGLLDGSVELVEDDAQTRRFGAEFDLVFSIFGVMFFEDPPAAFANLRSALREDGRLAFLCWRSFRDNPWVAIPLGAAAPHLELAPPEPGAPGPFALADAVLLREILDAAGFRDIEIDGCDTTVDLAPSVEEAMRFLMQVGPLATPLAQAEPAARLRALDAIRRALAEEVGEGPVSLPSATWLVRARR
jgi:SAM-dependent methyltransferase